MATGSSSSLGVSSYVRGFHTYKATWTPFIGEVLPLETEPTNPNDSFAVAIMKSGHVVGHLPYNFAPTISAFLRRPSNRGLAEDKINRGGGGLEIPCMYHFFGPEQYIKKLQSLVDKLKSDGLM